MENNILKQLHEVELEILKDFHDFFLTIGPAPFSIIEKEMNIWMDTILK